MHVPDNTYTVSREELERLRQRIGDLKAHPAELKHTATLIESMDRLHEAIARLIVIFEQANREMAHEAAQGIHDEHAKLDKLMDQNEKIARAVVQLADIVKHQRSQPAFSQPLTPQHTPAPMQPRITPPLSILPANPPMPLHVTPATPTPAPILTPQAPAAPMPSAPSAPRGIPGLPPLPPVATATPPVAPMPSAQPPSTSAIPRAPSFTPPPDTPMPAPTQSVARSVPPHLPALGEQGSFLAQPPTRVQPPRSPDVQLSPPPPPPPPKSSKRGLLDRFSFS